MAYPVVVLAALLACKSNDEKPQATAEPAAPPPAPAPAPEEKIEDFSGTYTTNWGSAKCTQVKKNVNCLYAGKSGSLDCKVVAEKTIECDWEEAGESGRTKLTKQDDGKLKGTWGTGKSMTNGGIWVLTPKK
jgi:hypothetical protein